MHPFSDIGSRLLESLCYGGVWDCSINFIIEKLYKNWSLWSTSLGALTTPPFFLELSAWS